MFELSADPSIAMVVDGAKAAFDVFEKEEGELAEATADGAW